jgi:hypothetical protein
MEKERNVLSTSQDQYHNFKSGSRELLNKILGHMQRKILKLDIHAAASSHKAIIRGTSQRMG